jgi:hypothetical protein
MRIFFLIGILSILSFTGCKKSEFTLEQIDPATVPELNTVGQNSSNRLVVALKGKVIEAIGQGGVANAISVCSEQGLFLTDSIARKSPPVIEIKRTSHKYRNPKNAPDAIDREVLDMFIREEVIDQSKIFRVTAGDTMYYRYYRPLVVAGLCVSCHGKTEQMDGALLEKIDQTYPADLARGYDVGDFRGVVCVSIRNRNQSD